MASKFPEEIFEDPSATELELFDFGKTIPARIATLTKVTSIRMGNSSATELPDALFQLPKLRSIDIGLDGLKKLPNAIVKAKALRELLLDHTRKLTELPANIGAMKLTELRNPTGGLKVVPPSLWNMKTLTWLALPDSVKKLPPGISKLSKLQTLELSGSALLSIAREVPKLKKLRKLSVDLGKETELPEEVAQLKLTELGIDSMTLTEMPAIVARLATLEELHAYGMYKLATLADVVEKLPNLSFVNVQKRLLPPAEYKRIAAHTAKNKS